MQLELPQCPVCTNAITAKTKVIASKLCGHAICSDCAGICFPLKRSGSCPVCRTSSASEGLLKLFIGFGEHDIAEVISSSDGDPDQRAEPAISMSSSRQARAQDIVARLRHTVQEASNSSDANSNLEGNMSFVQAGCLLRRIADSMNDCSQKSIICDIGDILLSMQDFYGRFVDSIKQTGRLKDEIREADELNKTKRSDVEETVVRNQVKYNRLKLEKEEREKELLQRIQMTKDEYRTEVDLRSRAEARVSELEAEVADLKKKQMRDRKKLIVAKQESALSQSKAASSSRLKIQPRNKHREPHLGSDSSLQIEEDDLDESLEDEDEICLPEDLPPSSAPTGTSFAGPSQESSASGGSQKPKKAKFRAPRREPREVDPHDNDDFDIPLDDILNAPEPSKKAKPHSSRAPKPPSSRAINVIPRMPIPSSRRDKGRDPLQASPKKKARLFVVDSST
ncbi:hypothetical protein SCHPADRAFT_995392 [Schizopora paradoxa]|uniref:RING-type domain-containing protein n=1 Tax=Schizopora paradoxa TaxID=27342 RepID=A0A0H2SG44_9AGAM|nr:hypothetical protein SCHPADRAFT_995392 [Schizopora paradoxa]